MSLPLFPTTYRVLFAKQSQSQSVYIHWLNNQGTRPQMPLYLCKTRVESGQKSRKSYNNKACNNFIAHGADLLLTMMPSPTHHTHTHGMSLIMATDAIIHWAAEGGSGGERHRIGAPLIRAYKMATICIKWLLKRRTKGVRWLCPKTVLIMITAQLFLSRSFGQPPTFIWRHWEI